MSRTVKKNISGWGRSPWQSCELYRPEAYQQFYYSEQNYLVRGQGRSYGDAALNEDGVVLLSERLNRFLSFDRQTGVICAESGVTLAEILDVTVPQSWFLTVTPGTKMASLGGCIAANVHGKNHHVDGAFSRALISFELFVADGRRLNCSREENSELFWATLGGMGLTGSIGKVCLQLHKISSAYIQARQQKAADLESLFQQLESPSYYSVAWIDCLARGGALGRGVSMLGEHMPADELPTQYQKAPLAQAQRKMKHLPLAFPSWALNSLSINLFNKLYFQREGRRGSFVSDYDSYFYPLDAIENWNLMYGKRGFLQYQCVLPDAHAFEGIKQLLETISRSRQASFLSVLKRMGEEDEALLSFPMKGYTLALDFPHRGETTLRLLSALDDIVVRFGGRVYLTKDARLSAEHFEQMYPRLDEWRVLKEKYDPDNRFTSSMARRLGMEVKHG